jgi:5-methylcytosine-specific restriction endonuclease McrA
MIKKKTKERLEKSLQNGDSISSSLIRKYLIETIGIQCQQCKNTLWNDLPITVEVEHIDGNSENNKLDNLTLLCPNCHSQTDTYKAKNMGNGRHSRRQRYQEGKSF